VVQKFGLTGGKLIIIINGKTIMSGSTAATTGVQETPAGRDGD